MHQHLQPYLQPCLQPCLHAVRSCAQGRRVHSRRYRLQHWLFRGLLLGLFLSVSLQLSTGCTQSLSRSSNLTTPEIRIGIISSLTGDDMNIGRATVDAAKLATQEMNDQGGLRLGRQRYPIELVIMDTQSTPEVATRAAQILINQENVVAIVGPQYSRYAIPVSRVAEQAKIPMISPRSTNPETTAGKRYIFRAIFTDALQGKVIARFAHQDLKAQRAAILYDIASPYNQGIAHVFKKIFTELGGTVGAFEFYTTGTQNFTTQLKKIYSSKPDVVFLPNYENEVPLQAEQAQRVGIVATLLGSDAWGSLREADRQWLEGAYFSDQYVPEVDNDITQGFIKRYQVAYGYEPEANAAATYDSMGILFSAIRKQGSTDPEAIRQGIAEFGEYHGVTGTLNYQGTGDPIVSVSILQIKNRKAIVYKEIEPET